MNSTNNNNDMAQLPKEKETQLFAGFEILIQNIGEKLYIVHLQ